VPESEGDLVFERQQADPNWRGDHAQGGMTSHDPIARAGILYMSEAI
jgi:hypothetical protein